MQREAIPAVLTGADLLVSSQTGSGKTAAFVLPGLQRPEAPHRLPGRRRAVHLVRQIERFTGNKVSLMEIEGLEPRRG